MLKVVPGPGSADLGIAFLRNPEEKWICYGEGKPGDHCLEKCAGGSCGGKEPERSNMRSKGIGISGILAGVLPLCLAAPAAAQ